MDAGRLAREAQIVLAAAALLVVGILRDQLSALVVLAAVVGALYLGWRAIRMDEPGPNRLGR